MSDDVFATIELDTFEETPASPQVEDDFTGIRIAMPAKVSAASLDRVALCGTWVFSNTVLGRYSDVEDNLVFLARNLETHESFTGNFRMHEDPANPGETGEGEPPSPSPSDSTPDAPEIGDDAITSQGWFNYNLGRVWKIPARPARYRIVVVLDDAESNAVDFEVTR